jgi:hypothetical protein
LHEKARRYSYPRSLPPAPGESVMENATVEMTIDDLLYIRAGKAILSGKKVVISLLKCLEDGCRLNRRYSKSGIGGAPAGSSPGNAFIK